MSCVSRSESSVKLKFVIDDTGIGIPASKISMLFKPFEQMDSSTTRKFGGTGLGLAISKKLAELMGGEIGVESVEGQGSSFWFTVSGSIAAQHGGLPPRVPNGIPSLKVLVADHSEAGAEGLVKYLTSWGMECVSAHDCASALEALSSGAGGGALSTSPSSTPIHESTPSRSPPPSPRRRLRL